MTAHLLSPARLRGVTLRNRIVVPPMCQYSAEDGLAGDYHLVHYGRFALGGAGLVILEATAVVPEGRITHGDLGLWSDAHGEALARTARFLKDQGAAAGLQLAHAGRKASMQRPWFGNGPLGPDDLARGDAPWPVVGPSAVPVDEGWLVPGELDAAAMAALVRAFEAAATRADRAGFDVIELHCAHGYLLHSFLSPLSNRRTDAYGGSLENRMRFPLEVFDAVRDAVPAGKPVWARVSATDWVEEGWEVEQTVAFAEALKARGAAAIHVSTGGVSPKQKIVLGPGYQVPFAERVRAATDLPTIAVGLITEPRQAEQILAEGKADAISLARAMLYDPRWPWHAAAELGARVRAPKQYWRSQPREYKDLFKDAAFGQR